MLQAMQTKVLEEGKKEKGLYKKFTCYCKNSVGTLEKSIATAKRQPCQFGYSEQGTAGTRNTNWSDELELLTHSAGEKKSVFACDSVEVYDDVTLPKGALTVQKIIDEENVCLRLI